MAGEKKYSLRTAALSVPLSEADLILAAGDGAAALLYLHMLRNGGCLDAETAAKDLRFSAADVDRAVAVLRGIGLIESQTQKGIAPPEEIPEYTAEEIVIRTKDDKEFTAILAETQRIFGRMLTGRELKTLFGIYDYLAIPAEVILLMINHCVEQYRKRNGSGRLPSMRSIEKEAYFWANREIITLERAEEHLHQYNKRQEGINILRRHFGIADREPSPSERQYMENWLELGFSTDSLSMAYDRTVTNTGKLAWKYMDTIVQSWHGKGLHSPEEIEKGDGRITGKSSGSSASVKQKESPVTRADIERMRKIREKIRSEQG